MTNKNLKLAAMSVALTACVAAQPLVAHAVDAPAEPEGKDPDPQGRFGRRFRPEGPGGQGPCPGDP